jgi:hypothetical protein
MRVSLPDDLVDLYSQYADAHALPVESVIADQLVHAAPTLGRPHLTLDQATLELLAKKLGAVTFTSVADLVIRVSQLAGIRFHRVDLDFTPSQLVELETRAARQGLPVERLIREILRTFNDQFFWKATGDLPVLVREAAQADEDARLDAAIGVPPPALKPAAKAPKAARA